MNALVGATRSFIHHWPYELIIIASIISPPGLAVAFALGQLLTTMLDELEICANGRTRNDLDTKLVSAHRLSLRHLPH